MGTSRAACSSPQRRPPRYRSRNWQPADHQVRQPAVRACSLQNAVGPYGSINASELSRASWGGSSCFNAMESSPPERHAQPPLARQGAVCETGF